MTKNVLHYFTDFLFVDLRYKDFMDFSNFEKINTLLSAIFKLVLSF